MLTVSAVLLGLLSPAKAQVDTAGTYFNLILYGGSADSVYVNHVRYHGLFVKGNCNSTNYGTTFLAGSNCWQRVHTNFLPRYWALTGQTPSNLVGPVWKEVDAINAAAYAAWSHGGDTIEIDSMVSIDRSVLALNKNTYWGTTDTSGFVRVDPPKTILTDTAHLGDGKIHVEDNLGFRTFQKINIAQGQGYDSIAGHASYTASVSQSLGGDSTIFLSGLSIQRKMLPGDSVSLFFPMVKDVSLGTDSMHFINLIFDGNRSQYTLNYDWRTNATIRLPTSIGSSIENCRFYNIPNENIFVCGIDVKNCSGAGFNGSAVHFSCNSSGSPTAILYNQFDRLNEVGDAVMQHSEAGFTFSAKVRDFHMSYNTITNMHEDGVGVFANDDSSNVITDNLLETNAQNVSFLPFYQHAATNVIYNNKNPNNADLSVDSCIVLQPQLTTVKPCMGNSSMNQPLQLGDTISIAFDSLLVRNSNESYVKQIVPLFSDSLFQLTGASVNTPLLAPDHNWNFKDTNSFAGLEFDNGHRDGVLSSGNWGYEPCGTVGGCTSVSFSFVVKSLPQHTMVVGCPLKGVKVIYDGELGTWDSSVVCNNQPVWFDSVKLGQPVVQGSDTCAIIKPRASIQLTNTIVQLHWDTVTDVSAYRIWYKPIGSNSWDTAVASGSQEAIVLSGLATNTQYRWMIQAKCNGAWGSLSKKKWFSTSTSLCQAVPNSDLVANPVKQYQARLNWTTQLGVKKYQIRWRLVGSSSWSTVEKNANKIKHVITGLSPATNYEWQLRTRCRVKGTITYSEWSSLQGFKTLTLKISDTPEDLLPPKSGWKLYPNPAETSVTVESVSLHLTEVRLMDILGHLLLQQHIPGIGSNQTTVLSLAGIPAGMYYVVVQTDEGSQQRLLVVE